MIPDTPVPLAKDSQGCVLEDTPRSIQERTNPTIFEVSLNRGWLSQLGIGEQGSPTVHALTTRPVIVQNPAIIIQPAEVDQ